MGGSCKFLFSFFFVQVTSLRVNNIMRMQFRVVLILLLQNIKYKCAQVSAIVTSHISLMCVCILHKFHYLLTFNKLDR
jgi:hypothetical protein